LKQTVSDLLRRNIGGIHAMLAGKFDRSVPQRFRQLCRSRLGVSKLLQLALQWQDWLWNEFAFTVHYQPHLGD
jgi:hypothetical protein